ncbi:MAG: leucine-rich repeat domain-containing protein [Oscillospiraceae bacterium]|nr:leucine-rich repeat domain-containing protein [Oscillospiraceae bacterium]
MTKAGKIIALTSIILCAVSFINKGLKYSNIPQFIFEYEKNDNGGITISDYTGKNSDVIIPDTIGKLPVTEIGYMGYNQKIKFVTIPDSVKKISESAFSHCENLEYINIPESVEYIGAWAFCGTPFEESLGNDDFIIINDKFLYKYNGNSDNVTIPDGVTSICNWVFSENNLINIEIPESVEYIGRGAFNKCENLKSIDIPENLKVLECAVFGNCKSLSEVSLPDGLEIIENKVFHNCTSIENISIPDKITEIPESAFEECSSLKEVNFPDGIKTIGVKAFLNCTSLENINFPESLETIGNDAFYKTALKEIILPESASSLGNHTFRECTSVKKSGCHQT